MIVSNTALAASVGQRRIVHLMEKARLCWKCDPNKLKAAQGWRSKSRIEASTKKRNGHGLSARGINGDSVSDGEDRRRTAARIATGDKNGSIDRWLRVKRPYDPYRFGRGCCWLLGYRPRKL